MDDKKRLLKKTIAALAAQAVCLVVSWYYLFGMQDDKREIAIDLRLEGEKVRDNLMKHLVSSDFCRHVIRMSAEAFLGLCDLLVKEGGLRPTIRVTVEEQVAKTLYLLGHNVKNRVLSFTFRRSGESTSRHFHNVLRAILELEDKFIKQPDGSQVPSEIANSSRFYPYFKVTKVNCSLNFIC